ncbi:MAG: DUF4783 domain-containing protein [Bacteroidetes bacterium]|nr:DUF4783 domain-containing protein [Bacteroidota bacterium]MBS1632325.1 DUF4783 domain-containing protein [Bacteroidota bacterium]
MKKIFTFLFLIPIVLLSSFTPQNDIEGVIGALRSGNAEELSKFFDDNVELTLPDKSDNYSKAQAVQILRDFFNINSVTSFEVKHKGDNGSGQYCIGTLQTKSGSFRTTVFMKLKGNKQVLKQIRFQPIE